MYVWEVRENGGYEGVYWSILVKDNDEALEKVKGILLKDLGNAHYWDLLAKSQIPAVNNLTKLSDYLEFEKQYESLEVRKIEVI